jgi:hypothetical protein
MYEYAFKIYYKHSNSNTLDALLSQLHALSLHWKYS